MAKLILLISLKSTEQSLETLTQTSKATQKHLKALPCFGLSRALPSLSLSKLSQALEVLSDLALAHELQLSSKEAEDEATRLSNEHLEAACASGCFWQCFWCLWMVLRCFKPPLCCSAVSFSWFK